MNRNEIIEVINQYVKDNCVDISSHDYWHIDRVYKMSLKISKEVESNEFIVAIIALLHDSFDPKFMPNIIVKDEIVKVLKELKVFEYLTNDEINNICHSIDNLGFKGGFVSKDLSIEGKIVQDADRLDAIGAISIARAFAYGGKMGRPIYDPIQGIIEIKTEEEYRNLPRHTINHFYEKLLKLKDLMNTEVGKKIALKRHNYMLEYLEQFFDEWNSRP